MKRPFVSVIVPAYNAEKYIVSCIESVLLQSYKNYELIIINDGSKDNTISIVKRYKEEHANIIVIDKTNSGVSDTRNKGIEVANGEYLMFLDSDDTLESEYIERHVNALTENVEMVLSRLWSSDGIVPYCRVGTYNELYQDRKLPWAFPFCKLFRSEIIKREHIKFDVNMRLCEDWKFTMDYIKYIDKIAVINYIGYKWNTDNGGSLSRGCSFEYRLEAYEQAICHLQDLHKIKGMWDPAYYDTIRRNNMKTAIWRMYSAGGTSGFLRRKRISAYYQSFGSNAEKCLNKLGMMAWLVDIKLKYNKRKLYIKNTLRHCLKRCMCAVRE